MRILKGLELINFRNIKNSKLEDFKDLNIFIGPNNSGKTNILISIDHLNRLSFSYPLPGELLHIVTILNQTYFNEKEGFRTIGLSMDTGQDESYKKKNKFKITYDFDRNFLNRKLLEDYGVSIEELGKKIMDTFHKFNSIDSAVERLSNLTLSQVGETGVNSSYISALSVGNMIDGITKKIILCPDSRYNTYKGLPISEYIFSTKPRSDDEAKLIKFIKFIIDSKIVDRVIDTSTKKISFLRLLDDEEFETLIDDQGSGIKSLVCLAWDIIISEKGSIILIDEPEIGINPSVKQEFLRFLIEESKEKQIFISTHDPTFLNPILWDRENVSVYLYSLPNENFVKINLDENKENPNVFAGYLPHTTSIKDIHFYVEGSLDVYIFQIFLQKFLRMVSEHKYETIQKEWYEILNKIGIYHLGGDFWEHLLYTIPKGPYKTIVILDGDKRDEAEKVVDKYNKSKSTNLPTFVFCRSNDELIIALKKGNCPVYCLKKDNIEKYLKPQPPNKYDGPNIADKMEIIPEEITNIFKNILDDVLKISLENYDDKQKGNLDFSRTPHRDY